MPSHDAVTENQNFVTKRAIRVTGLKCVFCEEAVTARLARVPGVKSVLPDATRNRVQVVYDASQVGFEQIEEALAELGYPCADNAGTRFKVWWFRYLDENARSNAFARTTRWSDPEDIYARRRRL
ncbi:MAG: heavy-metal-associated domain-containing protein [Gammaproteobacteria bacterium]|nr:heavy-metal-associated domain-containing protein [Gammaproteobacteria bacterium]NIR28302.1 heavy-metal-associated domain-containing protein [Gammaproteobacteria bacterium]NIR96716.1 heavy-metal-associated domain-containing protein [Gammaproteobacteria bacterium]NIT62418.1 heavy-metal-associated domain-containing protein [Gammaproteobacteria bacterium]NIV19351.1 hypothetical protein [Gammaproteobacteria bacterium]